MPPLSSRGYAAWNARRPHQIQQRVGALVVGDVVRQPVAETRVLQDRVPREQRVALEDHAALAAGAVDALAIQPDRAARRFVEARDQLQDRGFAATRWPQQADELTVANLERRLGERQQLAAASGICLADLIEFEPHDRSTPGRVSPVKESAPAQTRASCRL
jgi:hypothetical protein